MRLPKREYHYKGADTGNESRVFWIAAVIGLAVLFALIYFSR